MKFPLVVMPLFGLASTLSLANGKIITREDVANYNKHVIASIQASDNSQEINSEQREIILSNARSEFNRHTYYKDGKLHANEALDHFISHNNEYLDEESSHTKHGYGNYRYRRAHLGKCWVCGGYLRQFARRTPYRLVKFAPDYVIYSGRRYSARGGYFRYQGRYEKIGYNYSSRYWGFGRGYGRRLSF